MCLSLASSPGSNMLSAIRCSFPCKFKGINMTDTMLDKLFILFKINISFFIATFTAGWQANWTSLSVWFRTTLSDGVKSEEALTNNAVSADENTRLAATNTIPKLPVPDLQHTLTRYLEALEPILEQKHFIKTEKIVHEFGAENGVGERIQQSLLKRGEIYENWAYDWWLDDMYMNNPISLPINSNPGMVFPLRNFSSILDMAKFAARIVSSAVAFKEKIDRHELPVETAITNGVSQPLCMAQYGRIFTSYRAPGVLKDSLLKVETEFTKARPHVIIACREEFYVMHLSKGKNAEPLKENEIASQFAYILNESEKTKSTNFPIGLMTGLKRDWWATVRDQLLLDSTNKRNLSFIEKCLLIICLDMKELPSNFNSKSKYDGGGFKTSSRDETNMAHQMIHGGGSSANSGNRWFDKTIQLIISKDGVNGLCYEHSPAEGVAVINAVETILGACDDLTNITIDSETKIIPEKLSWNLTTDLEREMCLGKETFDKNVHDLDFSVLRFNAYGKNFIKSIRCSPDAFIQLALQLAYFKLHGNLCATYESASTRRFHLGRVDCIRAETMEVLQWVCSMEPNIAEEHSVYTSDSSSWKRIPFEKKLELFDAALKKQRLITTENITGYGIDVHLLGLRQMAKDHMIRTEIFEDESYTIANRFLLSTSQVATKINGFMGYGPVVPNGYGASYNPQDGSIIFCISSFQSCANTSTIKFTESLTDSLNAMKDLLVYRK